MWLRITSHYDEFYLYIVTIQTLQLFLGHGDSAFCVCSECASFIKAAGLYLLFCGVLLFAQCCMSEAAVNDTEIQSHPLSPLFPPSHLILSGTR